MHTTGEDMLQSLGSAVEQANYVVLIVEMDAQDPNTRRIVYANPALQQLVGYTPAEVVGRCTSMFRGPQTDSVVADKLTKAYASRLPVKIELLNYRKDGSQFWAEVNIHPIHDESVQNPRFVVVWFNIEDRKRSEEALRSSETRLSLLLSQTPAILWMVDSQLQYTSCSGTGLEALNPNAGQPSAVSLADKFQQHDPQHARAAAHRRALAGEAVTYEARLADRHFQNHVQPLRDADAKIVGAVGVALDVTERKVAEERIAFLAHRDVLTGLPNRALFTDRVKQQLASARRRNKMAAIVFIDLDRFKNVNDSLGHLMGDTLLKAVAERLTGAVRESDTVSRPGGDEFVVLIGDIERAENIHLITKKITDVFLQPFFIKQHWIQVTASVGVALFPDDGKSPQQLLDNADRAMYQAKNNGRDNVMVFTRAMHASTRLRSSTESDLRKALGRGQLMLYYQPMVGLADGSVHGVEALLRWKHPKRGVLLPSEFISIAEETGQIIPIGAWVLRNALGQAQRWSAAGIELGISINISPLQLRDANFLIDMRKAFEESGAQRQPIGIEITESAALQDPAIVRAALTGCKELGLSILLDDFGTKYASLTNLRQLPIDTLKIDRSFVGGVPGGTNDAAIVKSIIALGQDLGCRVVAEGVETIEQAAWLQRHGCQYATGYFYAQPMPVVEAEAWVRKTLKNARQRSAEVS